MSELVHVERRSRHGERCAYCHGSLEEPIVRCPSCAVECHADCARQLGRCPTLGCAKAVIQTGPFAPAPITLSIEPSAHGVAASASTSNSTSESTRGPRPMTIGRIPVMASASLAAAAILANTLVLLGVALHGKNSPLLLSTALVVTIATYLFSMLGVGARFFRLLPLLPQLRSLVRETPRAGSLHVRMVPGFRGAPGFEGTLSVEHGTPAPLRILRSWDEPWILHTQVVPVLVRGSGRQVLIESPAGHVAIVAFEPSRKNEPLVAEPTSVRARARRGWRR